MFSARQGPSFLFDLLVTRSRAAALVSKASRLGSRGRLEEALAAADAALQRVGATGERKHRELVGAAVAIKAMAFCDLGRYAESLLACQDYVDRFGSDPSDLRLSLVRVERTRAYSLAEVGRGEEAVAACDELFDRFGGDSDPRVRETARSALQTKLFALLGLERWEEAIETGDRMLLLSTDPHWLANVLLHRGIALSKLGRTAEAASVFDDVIGRFGDSPDLELRAVAGTARLNKGLDLDPDDAAAYFDQVASMAEEVPDGDVLVSFAMLRKARNLKELDRGEEAKLVLRGIVDRFKDSQDSRVQRVVEWARADLEAFQSGADGIQEPEGNGSEPAR